MLHTIQEYILLWKKRWQQEHTRNVWFQKSAYGIILLVGCALLFAGTAKRQQEVISQKLYPAVVRFHVLADSDEKEAQALKLIVRDALLEQIEPWLEGIEGQEEAIAVLSRHTEEIKERAEAALREQGCDLAVKVELTRDWFPVKQYGSLVLPAGENEALRVSIGSAAGKNWWCMLFPGLCFLEDSYKMEEEKTGALQEVLTEEEFQAIWQDGETKVKVRFQVWEWLQHYFHNKQHK